MAVHHAPEMAGYGLSAGTRLPAVSGVIKVQEPFLLAEVSASRHPQGKELWPQATYFRRPPYSSSGRRLGCQLGAALAIRYVAD